MSNKSPFGSESHFAKIGSWKAGSPTSNPPLLKAQSRQLFIGLQESGRTTESTITASFVTNLGDHKSVTRPSASLHEADLLCLNEGMGVMQPQCTGGGACCRSQEPASCREFMIGIPERSCRNGCLKQVCRTNLLSAVEFCEHRQLKGWQPHFQPTVAKSSISTTVHWFAGVR